MRFEEYITVQLSPSRVPKSIGAERTFHENLTSEVYLSDKIKIIAEELDKRIQRYQHFQERPLLLKLNTLILCNKQEVKPSLFLFQIKA